MKLKEEFRKEIGISEAIITCRIEDWWLSKIDSILDRLTLEKKIFEIKKQIHSINPSSDEIAYLIGAQDMKDELEAIKKEIRGEL